MLITQVDRRLIKLVGSVLISQVNIRFISWVASMLILQVDRSQNDCNVYKFKFCDSKWSFFHV